MGPSWAELFYPKDIISTDTDKLQRSRVAFATLAKELQEVLPEGRYKSIVLTLLEQAAAMATKAFSHG